jgi:uncharacterized protein YndB with AHSA1/START domain
MTQTNDSMETTSTQPAGATSSVSSPDKRELVITRIFDAPRDLVFKVWTDPKHVAQWWGPKWFTNPVCELDVRPGGTIRIEMADPEGVRYPMRGVFREIVAPERLVFTTTALEDDQGNPQLEGLTTVTFAEYAGKTKLTLHVTMVKAEPGAAGALAGMEEGWNQSLDKLAEYLAKE